MQNNYNTMELKKFMIKTIGKNIVENSIRNPNKNDDIILNTDKLLNYFSDNKIHEYAKKNNWPNEIPIQKFVDFLIDHANGNGTRSKYHEYMEFHPSLFGLSIDRGVPDYGEILNPHLRKKIEYKRDEYIPCFWIVNKIKNHEFLKNYLELSLPSFQKVLSENDNRFYDIVFDKLNIIIEVQEDASHHDNNSNDILKESLALYRDNYIMYFKMNSYRTQHMNYFNAFWNLLYDHILASLMKDSSIRQNYVIYKFRENCHDNLKILQTELLGHEESSIKYKSIFNEINKLKAIITTNPKETIAKIFKWKHKSINESNKYCIKLIDILVDLLNLSDAEDKLLEYMTTINYFQHNNDENIYITWETMMELISNSDINRSTKSQVNYYLVNVQHIYEDICNIIIIDADERKKIFNIDIAEQHIELKVQGKYEYQIEKIKLENDRLQKEIKISRSTFNKLQKSIDDHKKLKSIIEKLQNEQDFVTINLTEHNKSIFVELIDFPIKYSIYEQHFITISDFNAYCDIAKINKSYRNELIHRLFGCKNTHPNILNHMIINNDYNSHIDCNLNSLTYLKMMDDYYNMIKNVKHKNNQLNGQFCNKSTNQSNKKPNKKSNDELKNYSDDDVNDFSDDENNDNDNINVIDTTEKKKMMNVLNHFI